MKKFNSALLACVSLAFAATNVYAQDQSLAPKRYLSECISIRSGEKSFNITKNQNILLNDCAFDIFVDKITTDEAVYLFAYHNEDFMNKYQLPIKTDETEMFCPGSGLAESVLDPEKGYSLSINNPSTFHYLHEPRRLNNENSCVIPVRKITDPTGKFSGKIYFSLFVDYNNDSVIDENEYSTFVISFSPLVTFDSNDFSKENRGYVSSMGYTVKRENYSNASFQTYKITSEKGFEKFVRQTKKNFSGKTPKDYFNHLFDQKNMDDCDIYLVMAPNNMSFINNPFKIIGNNALIFEVEEVSTDKTPVSLRVIRKAKSEPDIQISFYSDGKIIPAKVKTLSKYIFL